MRKRINILFVVLAISSVTYGMVLRYSDKSDELLSVGAELSPEEEGLPEDEFVRFSDDIIDLDALVAEPD
ncbi:MAG: hypothetical protein HEP71_32525 [Roseivirga sp.]|nr:hypothetical protein [Roseivirga sp.]